MPDPAHLLLLTAGTQIPGAQCAPSPLSSAANGSLLGLTRSMKLEHKNLPVTVASVSPDLLVAASPLFQDAVRDSHQKGEFELAWCGSTRFTPRLREVRSDPENKKSMARGSSYVILDGASGLGQRAASALEAQGAAHVLVASASGRVARAAAAVVCDPSQPSDLVSVIQRLAGQRVGGVLHATGVIRDTLLQKLQAEQVAAVFAGKAIGARYLHALVLRHSHASLVLFSSVTSILGNVGQGDYMAANAYLDVLSQCRRAHAAAGCSVQLPLVAGNESDRAAPSQYVTSGFALPLNAFATALGTVMTARSSGLAAAVQMPCTSAGLQNITLGVATPFFTELSWEKESVEEDAIEVEEDDDDDDAAEEEAAAASSNPLQNLPAAERQSLVMDLIRRTLVDLGASSTSLDVPLMESGLDSLAATELASRLGSLTALQLSSTLAFDQPTPRALGNHL
eukprot:4530662-Prymnesium_polylepis.1